MPRPEHDGTPAARPNRVKLTDPFIRHVEPGPARTLYHDTVQEGLALAVEATGHKSFKLIYRFAGRPRWFTFGSAGRIGHGVPGARAPVRRRLCPEAQQELAPNPEPDRPLCGAGLGRAWGPPDKLHRFQDGAAVALYEHERTIMVPGRTYSTEEPVAARIGGAIGYTYANKTHPRPGYTFTRSCRTLFIADAAGIVVDASFEGRDCRGP